MIEPWGTRPTVDGALLPFACVAKDGGGRHDQVVKARALQCALSRVCSVCGEALRRPMAFVAPPAEAAGGLFAFPAGHEECLRQAAADPRQHLGHAERPEHWELVVIAGFDVVRPTRRGEPVAFRANAVVSREALVVGG